jgi:transcriptional regulator GlxA family with amidase domain
MKIRRFTSEQSIIRQLRHFVNANDSMGREVFSRESDIQASLSGQQYRLDEDFMSLMLKMAPYLNSYSSSQLTLGELCKVGNVSHKTFLNLVSKNITKKPYEFIRRLRLQQAANLLKASDKSVEDIADECGFCSPNFFVASFFRQYRLTPQEYRQSENQLSITH